MTVTLSTSGATLPWLVRRSAVLLVGALPSAIALGALGLAATAPLVLGIAFGAPWLAAAATLPPALLLTGTARFAATLVAGDRARVRDGFRLDPVLGLLLAAPSALGVLLIATGGPARILGDVIVAATVLVGPFVAGYAAVRGRRGAAAWRGGLILLAYRPSWGLTFAALSVIGAIAIIASAGVLALVIPPYLVVLGTAMCAVLLTEIDELQTR